MKSWQPRNLHLQTRRVESETALTDTKTISRYLLGE
nr:unnamed protein product [Callosobruchus analis]